MRAYLRMTCTDMGLTHLLPSANVYRALCGVDGIRWTEELEGKPQCGLCTEERAALQARTPPPGEVSL